MRPWSVHNAGVEVRFEHRADLGRPSLRSAGDVPRDGRPDRAGGAEFVSVADASGAGGDEPRCGQRGVTAAVAADAAGRRVHASSGDVGGSERANGRGPGDVGGPHLRAGRVARGVAGVLHRRAVVVAAVACLGGCAASDNPSGSNGSAPSAADAGLDAPNEPLIDRDGGAHVAPETWPDEGASALEGDARDAGGGGPPAPDASSGRDTAVAQGDADGIDARSVASDADFVVPPAPGPSAAARAGFVAEQYGVGASWYAYDGASHALTPKPELYAVRGETRAALVEIVTYYDARGESGTFTLMVRTAASSAGRWGDEQVIRTGRSVKDGPVCVDFDSAAVVSCYAPHDLLLRTDRRVIPAAGFAVAEPGLHFVGRAGLAPPTLWRLPRGDTPAPNALESRPVAPSVLASAADAALGSVDGLFGEPSVVQATPSMKLVEWRVAAFDDGGNSAALGMVARCVPLASAPASQQGWSGVDATRVDVEVHVSPTAPVARVSLCRDGTPPVATLPSTWFGGWTSGDAGELLFWRGPEGWRIAVAPGSLVYAPDQERGVADTLPGTAAPSSLWD